MAAPRVILLAATFLLTAGACACVLPDPSDPAASGTPVPAPSAEAALIEATVRRAVDGDSLDARVFNNRTQVGYLGVAAPSPRERCGPEALARNSELAGDRVLLEEDPAYGVDERDRRLYYAYTADGRSIDEILVREGLARAVRTDARYGTYLAQVQAEAEVEGRGCLWSTGD